MTTTPNQPSRRQILATAPAFALGAAVASAADANAQDVRGATRRTGGRRSFKVCLNTSTVRGANLKLDQQFDLAIGSGYDGIEPWVRDIENFVKDGGSLKDLGKKAKDNNLAIASAIGFANWIVDDNDKRAAALEQARRESAMLKQLGGTHIAAPPAGANRSPLIDLDAAAARYRDLIVACGSEGIIPMVEVWGFATNITRLSQAMYIAAQAGHKDASVLADAYHLYKGGSDFAGLKLLGSASTHAFHINDYPDIPRDQINDADRVYPGDGVAPLKEILGYFIANNNYPTLSLELFNRTYWEQDPKLVARTGLEKTRAAIAAATA
ncbi:MAG: sugar phosphate isomerase/epimerase family protein [Planctomycetota bacterium]|jgi:2-keto-myo-inositol isomerase